MKGLPERIAEAIQDFKFHEYDETGDLDPTTPYAVATWVYDLGEHIATKLYLPIVAVSEEARLEEIVHKFLQAHGTPRTVAYRGELVSLLKEHLRNVLVEASAAGFIEKIEGD